MPELVKEFDVSVTLVDPCASPTYGYPNDPSAEAYTITDTDKTVPLSPAYTIEPSWCGCDYALDAGALTDSLTFNDGASQGVTLAQISDSLTLSGRDNIPLDVTQTYAVKLTCTTQDYAKNDVVDPTGFEYDQEVKDPCIDQNFVVIAPVPLVTLTYDVFSGEEVLAAHADY